MTYADQGCLRQTLCQQGIHRCLGILIKCGGCFIEEKPFRLLDMRTHERQTLLLTHGKHMAPISN